MRSNVFVPYDVGRQPPPVLMHRFGCYPPEPGSCCLQGTPMSGNIQQGHGRNRPRMPLIPDTPELVLLGGDNFHHTSQEYVLPVRNSSEFIQVMLG